jgi:hypothetical protein
VGGLPGHRVAGGHHVERGFLLGRAAVGPVPPDRGQLDRHDASGRLQQPGHPGVPAYLAVGEDLDARLALQLQRFQRGPVLGLR